jgi:hypothetical protein
MPLKLPLAAGQVLGSVLEKSQRPRAPLRNRTVDLLLTMNPRKVPLPQVVPVDQGKTRAHASTHKLEIGPREHDLPLDLPFTLILFRELTTLSGPQRVRAVKDLSEEAVARLSHSPSGNRLKNLGT